MNTGALRKSNNKAKSVSIRWKLSYKDVFSAMSGPAKTFSGSELNTVGAACKKHAQTPNVGLIAISQLTTFTPNVG